VIDAVLGDPTQTVGGYAQQKKDGSLSRSAALCARNLDPNGYPPVIVAVITVHMMEVVVHYVVHVITVGNLRMPAARTVDVVLPVLTARMLWGAARRVGRADRKDVLVHMVAVDMVQVPIVQIVGVVPVLHGDVATTCAMLVVVSFVYLAVRLWHALSLSGVRLLRVRLNTQHSTRRPTPQSQPPLSSHFPGQVLELGCQQFFPGQANGRRRARHGNHHFASIGAGHGPGQHRGCAHPVSYTHLTLPTICSV